MGIDRDFYHFASGIDAASLVLPLVRMRSLARLIWLLQILRHSIVWNHSCLDIKAILMLSNWEGLRARLL